jgi:hypothetical protein
MGDFRMTIEATGGHGCDRVHKQGEQLQGCGRMDCPDCVFATFVSQMQRLSMRPMVAILHHWPADMNPHFFVPGSDKVDDKCVRCSLTRQETTATHRCKVCNALWRLNPAEPEKFPADHPFHKETWSLVSAKCQKCCDNVAMGEQIAKVSPEEWPRTCRNYRADSEVIDDYSEKNVKYPTGGFTRATGVRVKGHF